MLRKASFLAMFTILYLLAPVVSRADQGSVAASAAAGSTVQGPATLVETPANAPTACQVEGSPAAEFLPKPHPVTSCTDFACTPGRTNCKLLCGDFAQCLVVSGSVGHCNFV